MEKITKCLFLLILLPVLLQAQYMGGNGRGDISVNLTNVPLPVQEVTEDFPTKCDLKQNYPNPFNPSTVINYQLPVGGDVMLKVYDILGNEVATLVDEFKPAGRYEVEFSAGGGSAYGGNVYNLPSGVYFYQLKAGDYIETKKMILMK